MSYSSARTVIGVWKISGALALLPPRLPRLKEWVYAGIFFNMTGAALSHAAMGDYGSYAFHLTVPLFFAVLALVSWALPPDNRTLGVIFPASPTPAIELVDNQALPVPR
ncbi:MAG: DoxX family protein [Caldilineaceae bacterium]